MSPQIENALRSVARKCRDEFLKAIDGKPKKEHDRIITAILDKHTKTIQYVPPDTFKPKAWLIYFVRKIDQEKHNVS